MTSPFRLNLALTWLIGCALAILVLQLTGCGEVTQIPTEDGSTNTPGNPNFRGEISQDASLPRLDASVDSVSDNTGGKSDSGDRADGGVNPTEVQAPVCPPHLTCDVTTAECRALCPSCTEKQDGKCISDGFCVCRDGGS